MKKLWFLFLLSISCAATGQPPVKIYAYSQVLTPGTVPKNVTDENGNPVNIKKEPSVNYYIFAAYPGSARISFCEVWINSRYYKVQTRPVDSTPVINTNYNIPANPVKEVLVPATRLRVISLSPIDPPDNSTIHTTWFGNMLKHSALVAGYLYNGKKYFISVKKIKMLQPVAGV
jgi:hypothetical protein